MIEVAEEVRAALAEGRPVVALESTLIAHGLPSPEGRETAGEMEAAVRSAGAVPATVAVLGGRARLGLEAAELDRLADPGRAVAKCGAADLAPVMATGGDGATTVSATCLLAARAAVRVMATGGIGGVHRGGSGDVSSDLAVLGSAPVAVVASGAKVILDLPRTLEALESAGVPVLGYRTGELPAFYAGRSGLPLEHRLDRPEEVARVLRVRFDVLGQGGVLVAHPPPEDEALDAGELESIVRGACDEAARAGVRGKPLTPFLLERLAEGTGGRAVAVNRSLAVANAGAGAEIAAAYARAKV